MSHHYCLLYISRLVYLEWGVVGGKTCNAGMPCGNLLTKSGQLPPELKRLSSDLVRVHFLLCSSVCSPLILPGMHSALKIKTCNLLTKSNNLSRINIHLKCWISRHISSLGVWPSRCWRWHRNQAAHRNPLKQRCTADLWCPCSIMHPLLMAYALISNRVIFVFRHKKKTVVIILFILLLLHHIVYRLLFRGHFALCLVMCNSAIIH